MTKHEWKVGDQAIYKGTYGKMKSLVGQDVVIHAFPCQSIISIRFSNGCTYWVHPNCLEPIPSPKDPFSPGEYVTCAEPSTFCIKNGVAKVDRRSHRDNDWFFYETNKECQAVAARKIFFRPATPEEIAEYKAKYEAQETALDPKPEPFAESNSETRITFNVGGQEFYIGQQVWSDSNYRFAPLGVALEVIGPFNGFVVTRAENTSLVAHMSISNISTTPPAPNERKRGDWEWKRGDWALHKDGRKAFVCWTCQPYGQFTPISLMVSFATEAAIVLPASEFTFIGHTEAPE